MDMNDLTIGQAKELAQMFGGEHATTSPFINQYVIVRSRDAGVHAGRLVSASGDSCVLHNSRRLWKWVCQKGDFLSGVAKYGITEDSKVGTPMEIQVLGVCEIIPCSLVAAQSINEKVSAGE